MDVSETDMQRYSRQVILPGFGPEGQARLREARVLVVGLGGLGSPVSLYLAAAGVGTLGLADADTVERSNLHRQVLHGEADLGRPKVESARERLLDLNPGIRIQTIREGIHARNALDLFGEFDLVVDGTDNFPARYLINDAAYLAGRPLVYGSIFQFEGQVTVFHPAHGSPCYRCLFPELPQPGTVPNCAEAGVFGALCGIVGSWQASEALKLLTGLGTPLLGRLKVINTLSGRDSTVKLKSDPACPLCGKAPTLRQLDPSAYTFACQPANRPGDLPLEMDSEEAVSRMRSSQPPRILDVREPFERSLCRLPDDWHIPTGKISQGWRELPRHEHLLVYCHHGIRSLSVTRYLREKGFSRVQSLRGGIDGWSREVDPTVPRY